MTEFLAAAALLTVAGVAFITLPLLRGSRTAPVAALLTAIVIPVVVLLLYAAVSDYPWAVVGDDTAESTRQAMLAPPGADLESLRAAANAEPGNVQALLALGDGFLALERFGEARDAYARAMEQDGGQTDDVRLAFVEASILADRSTLTGEAGRIIDEVLARDPGNPKALWYGGMAALSRGDDAAARARWSALLEFSPPAQVRQVIEQQIAALEAGGADVGPASGKGGTVIPVRVRVSPDIASQVRDGAALFVIARAPGGEGPPLAVVRRQPATLPIELQIGDADGMMPGKGLAELGEVALTARIANGGEPVASPGDVFGAAMWQRDAGDVGPVEILIDKVVD
jgi:cytochrome c-type biogenesis protein CcmH